MNSAIYRGRVRHRRPGPTPHAFDYRIFLLFADLAEVPRMLDGRPQARIPDGDDRAERCVRIAELQSVAVLDDRQRAVAQTAQEAQDGRPDVPGDEPCAAQVRVLDQRRRDRAVAHRAPPAATTFAG